MNEKSNPQPLGKCIFDRSLLSALKTLWEGDLHPDCLPHIEKALRCMLLYKQLDVGLITDPFSVLTVDAQGQYEGDDNRFIFDGISLDYEFSDAAAPQQSVSIPENEKLFLVDQISSRLVPEAQQITPNNFRAVWEYEDFIDYWYRGLPRSMALDIIKNTPTDYIELQGRENQLRSITKDGYFSKVINSHPVAHRSPDAHGIYLLETNLAGYAYCSHSPISKICHEHLYSRWPEYIFSQLDKEYEEQIRKIREPSIVVNMPLLVSIVLSRASKRSMIPGVIVTLRQEFEDARLQLWGRLSALWTAPTLKEQIEIERELQSSADSIFKAAFPDQYGNQDVLSLALELAQCTSRGVADAGKRLLAYDRPNSHVRALTFAYKLSQTMRDDLLNCHILLKRHLSEAELSHFMV